MFFAFFYGFFYQRSLLLSFRVDSLHILYHYYFHVDIFGVLFVKFFHVFYGFLVKVACFYLFVPILFISFTIISSMLTFFVIYLLRFSHFFRIFWLKVFLLSFLPILFIPLTICFLLCFWHSWFSVCYVFLVFYGFLIKGICFYLFVSIPLISFTIISSMLTFLVIYLLRFSCFLGFSDQSCVYYLFCRFSLSLLRLVLFRAFLHFSFSICYVTVLFRIFLSKLLAFIFCVDSLNLF